MAKEKIKVEKHKDGSATAHCPKCKHKATISLRPFGKGRSGNPDEVAVSAIKGHLIAQHGASLGEYF